MIFTEASNIYRLSTAPVPPTMQLNSNPQGHAAESGCYIAMEFTSPHLHLRLIDRDDPQYAVSCDVMFYAPHPTALSTTCRAAVQSFAVHVDDVLFGCSAVALMLVPLLVVPIMAWWP